MTSKWFREHVCSLRSQVEVHSLILNDPTTSAARISELQQYSLERTGPRILGLRADWSKCLRFSEVFGGGAIEGELNRSTIDRRFRPIG